MSSPAAVALARGEGFREAKRPAQALEALGPALIDPATTFAAQCTRALALADLDRTEEALGAARLAQAADPLDERGFRIEALIRVNGLKGKGAEAPARESVRLSPNLWNRYILVLALKGPTKQAEARALATALLADEPNAAEAFDALGVVEIRAKHWAEAETLYRRALELSPHTALFATRLGVALQAQKKTAEAGEAYLAAARSEPTNTEHRSRLGRVGLAIGGGAFAVGKVGLLGKLAFFLSAQSLLHLSSVAGASVAWWFVAVTFGLVLTVRQYKLRRGTEALPADVQTVVRGDHQAELVTGMLACTGVLCLPATALVVIGEPDDYLIPVASTAFLASAAVAMYAYALERIPTTPLSRTPFRSAYRGLVALPGRAGRLLTQPTSSGRRPVVVLTAIVLILGGISAVLPLAHRSGAAGFGALAILALGLAGAYVIGGGDLSTLGSRLRGLEALTAGEFAAILWMLPVGLLAWSLSNGGAGGSTVVNVAALVFGLAPLLSLVVYSYWRSTGKPRDRQRRPTVPSPRADDGSKLGSAFDVPWD